MFMHTTALECSRIKLTWSYCSVFFIHASVPLALGDCTYTWPLRNASSLRNIRPVRRMRFTTCPLTSSIHIRSVTCPHLLPAPFLVMFPRPHLLYLPFPLPHLTNHEGFRTTRPPIRGKYGALLFARSQRIWKRIFMVARHSLEALFTNDSKSPTPSASIRFSHCMAFVLQYRTLCSTKSSRLRTTKMFFTLGAYLLTPLW